MNTTRGITELGDDHHYFVSSCLHWTTGTKLWQVIAKQKRKDQNKRSPYKASTYAVYIVPGPEDSSYKINNYTPQVEGTTLLFAERY